MKKQRLTKTEKRGLAHRAFMSVALKADSYPAWMQEYFYSDMSAYNDSINRNSILPN